MLNVNLTLSRIRQVTIPTTLVLPLVLPLQDARQLQRIMLEKMKSKVQEDEALAESYGEMAMIETNVDMEINKALEGEANPQASDSLASLKAKMGINK